MGMENGRKSSRANRVSIPKNRWKYANTRVLSCALTIKIVSIGLFSITFAVYLMGDPKFADMESAPNYDKLRDIPVAAFGREKFVLSLSLMIDIVTYLVCLLNIIKFQAGVDNWTVSVSVVNIGTLCSLLVLLGSTLYAFYGILVLSLDKFNLLFLTSVVMLFVVVFILIAHIFIWLKIFEQNLLRLDDDNCKLLYLSAPCIFPSDHYLNLVFIICGLTILHKAFQLCCFMALHSNCVHFNSHEYNSIRRRQQQQKPQTSSMNKNDSDSEDEDVIVFERVIGSYPGGAQIKDASIS